MQSGEIRSRQRFNPRVYFDLGLSSRLLQTSYIHSVIICKYKSMSKIRQGEINFGSKLDFSTKSFMTLAFDLEMWFNVTEHS